MLSHWWVKVYFDVSPILLGCWVFWVIGSITLHELAHGWAAIRQGDRTPIDSGHMSYNPVVHMGVQGLMMFAVAGFAYGAMPVDPSRFRSRYGDAMVSAAGPAMNLLLALLCLVGLCVWIAAAGGYWVESWNVPTHVFNNFQTFFRVGAAINTMLMVFNLLPVPPLDGSHVLADFVPSYRRLVSDPRAQGPALVVFVLIFVFAGDAIFQIAIRTVDGAKDAVLGIIAPLAV